MKSSKVKTPWYEFYDGVKAHLDYPDYSVYKMFEESVKKHSNNISYNYFGNKKTYSEFYNQIEECAKSFKSMGLKKNDVVSICMPNTPEALISFYGLNKIGVVANMIHPLSAENEIKYFINISKSKYIISIDIAFNKINHILKETNIKKVILVSAKNSMPLGLKIVYNITKQRKIKLEKSDKVIWWNDFIKLGKDYAKKTFVNTKSDDIAAILYSGGTSGYPKGIELTNLNFNALAMQSFEVCHCLSENDKVLAIMPVFHGFGLGICIHTVQYFGGCSIILPQFSAKTFGGLLKSEGLDNYDLSFLKCVISGGDSLSVSLKKKIDEFLHNHGANIQIREGYGLTECVTGSCLTPEKYYREGSIGIPYPDTYYKIIDSNTNEELPYGKEGEIVISGPSVMKGYLNDKKETDLTLKKHNDGIIWMHTGDLGSMDKDGFIYFKQRIKRVIISSGYCIYPQYIENIIDSVPEVLMSCVIGINHPYKVQVAKAFIVLKDKNVNKEQVLNMIKEKCEKDLAKYSRPYEYEFRDELPKTLVGKVAFNELSKEEQNKNENK